MVFRLRVSPPEAAHQRQGHRNRLATQNVHLDRLEGGQLVTLHRQRRQRRGIQLGKGTGAAARQLLEGTLIEPLQERLNRLVHLAYARKALVAQAGHDPALDDLDRRFRLGLLASQQLSVMRNVA